MFKKYNEVTQSIKNLNVPLKTRLLYGFISLLIAFLFVSGPLCVLINLMIFKDFQKLLSFGIATLLLILIVMSDIIYIYAITNKRVPDVKIIYLTDAMISAIFIYIVLVALFIMGVV